MPAAAISGVIWNTLRRIDFGAVLQQHLDRFVVIA